MFFKHKLHTKCSIFIQRFVRVLLAKLELHRLRQRKAAIILQRQLKRIAALNVLAQMRADRLFWQKTDIATKIQTLYRMKVARRSV